MTVSKALRDAPDISANTRSRIKARAQAMGYQPDPMAQALRTRRTRLFGLVISTMINPIFSRILLALVERVHEMGYDLIVAHTHNDPDREEACVRRMLSRRVDGLFLYPVYRMAPTCPIYEEMRKQNTPVVILGHPGPSCQGFTYVENDDIEASQILTGHLLELGHRRIAFLAGPQQTPWAQERLEGYRQALRRAGVDFDDQLIFNAGRSVEDGARAAEQFLRERPDVTAVQAVNDLVAVGAGNALLNAGLRIPEDLSLVGYGNILTSEYFRVPLTTVRQAKFRLGQAAVDSLLQIMAGEKPVNKRLPGQIIVRKSTGAPRQHSIQPLTPPSDPDPGVS